MFEKIKLEGATAGGPHTRLGVMIGGLLVLGAIIFGIAQFSGKKGPEQLPGARPAPGAQVPEEPEIDVARLPSGDDETIHDRYQPDAIAYLREIVDRDLSLLARRVAPEQVAALSFAEGRGQVFEVEGTIEAITQEAWGPNGTQRLWSVLIEGSSGGRVIVLRYALGSDHEAGRPDDAFRESTEYVEVGDRVLARGIYLQRRTGTFGSAILRDPVPVLMGTPPAGAFRILPRVAVPIGDLTEADWDDIRDRYIGETLFWQEPALFQTVQWVRAQGHPQILADIREGRVPAEYWGRDLFDEWGSEVENEDSSAPRPLTESLRGRLFKLTGLIGSFQKESWATMPREASAWGIDTLYLLDLISDYWGNRAIRCWSAFPLETYGDVKGEKWEHVAAYGFFLKNHTYKLRAQRDGTLADHTMPMFIVVHIEPLPVKTPPYGALMWVIGGVLVVLAVVFYFVLGRGAKRDEERLHQKRLERRRRARQALGAIGKPSSGTGAPGEEADGGEDGSSEDGSSEESDEEEPGPA